MADVIDKALERVRAWPVERQREAAELLLALDEMGGEAIEVDDATLAAIDEALTEVREGRLADPKEVEALFARHRS